MMKTIDLLVTKNERVVTNISQKYQNATVKRLKTRYMTLSSYDDNNEYNGFDIDLRIVDCKDGVAHFEICKEGDILTSFTINATDDPIIIFDEDEPGVEHHVFEKLVDYEFNQELKPGCLYRVVDSSLNFKYLMYIRRFTEGCIDVDIMKLVFNEGAKCTRIKTENYLFSSLDLKDMLFTQISLGEGCNFKLE